MRLVTKDYILLNLHLHTIFRISKFTEIESRLRFLGAGKGRDEKWQFMGMGLLFEGKKNVLNLDDNGCTILIILKIIELYSLHR